MEKEIIYQFVIIMFIIVFILVTILSKSRQEILDSIVKVNLKVYAPDSRGDYRIQAEFTTGVWKDILIGEDEDYIMSAATELVQDGQFRILNVYRHPIKPLAKSPRSSTPVFKQDL